MEQQEAEKILNGYVERLGEHFDCISIVVTSVENGQTHLFYRCHGNIYAIEGMLNSVVAIIQEHINKDVDKHSKRDKDSEKEDEDEDDAEEWKKQI